MDSHPPAETGSANELVTLTRRPDAAEVFAALGGLVTYRVNAARAQSHLRRLAGLARGLNRAEIDPDAPARVRGQVLDWLDTEVAGLKATADFSARAERMTRVRVQTTVGRPGGFEDGRASTPMGDYEVAASEVDVDRLFEAAGQRLGEGGATGLETWERELMAEELQNPQVVGWLRNLPRKPWSLEIPYESGGASKPMFPDLVVVRAGGAPGEYRFDILEPHNPSLADNFEKARGLARFAGRHGHRFDRIELIRKRTSPGGGFARLNLNSEAVRGAVLLVTGNPHLDAVFEGHAGR